MIPLFAGLVQHLAVIGAKSAAAALDGDSNTKASSVLKESIQGLYKSPVMDDLESIAVDALIKPEDFGAYEKEAEEHLKAIIDHSQALADLMVKAHKA
jgi:hypothetical protein